MDAYFSIVPLFAGWILDLLFADPQWLPHPVVGFGKAISFFEHRLNKGKNRKLKGAVASIGLIISTFAFSWLLLRLLGNWNVHLRGAVEILFIFFCLAGTTLIREVRMVFEAVDRSIEEGRTQVGRIVGRDTSALSAQEVRIAALETLAENLSDGVIAPLFWYALLGVPGMLSYKMINTLDSMVGYRNERYRDYGCVAAHIDDIANYLPARITSALMILVAGRPGLAGFVIKYGRKHLSPNSGWPESALAGILGCRFGGPHDYFGETVDKPFIGEIEREINTADMKKATAVNRGAEILMVILTAAVRLLLL